MDLMLAFITGTARHRRSDWWVSLAFIAASCASLALGSYFSVRSFKSALDGMAITGGGIASVRFAIWQGTQPALAAAWLALALTLLACLFVLPRGWKELTNLAGARRLPATIVALLTGFALVGGVIPVLLFQRAIAFVLWAITPAAHAGGRSADWLPRAIASRLLVTATVRACCALILIALVALTVVFARRFNPSRPLFVMTVFALVMNLGVSAVLVANLRSFSNRFHTAALTGRMPSE